MYSISLARKNKQVIKDLSFNNVDIYYIELDGIINLDQKASAIRQFNEEINRFVGTEYFALHVHGTKICKKDIEEIVKIISKNKEKVKRLAIVGSSFITRLYFGKLQKENINYFFCNDYQRAKELLVDNR